MASRSCDCTSIRAASLTPVDFFAPFDAGQLDIFDGDFGSGAFVGLPDAYFGTSTVPHLGVIVGKEGYVYLLNRDHLGGYDQGPDGADDVVQRTGPRGGVWGRPGVWPGDGGYVYIPTSSGQNGGGLFDVYKYGLSGTGTPSLSLVASSPDVFGWGSGPPVITSDGTTSGSALVWTIWSANRRGQAVSCGSWGAGTRRPRARLAESRATRTGRARGNRARRRSRSAGRRAWRRDRQPRRRGAS